MTGSLTSTFLKKGSNFSPLKNLHGSGVEPVLAECIGNGHVKPDTGGGAQMPPRRNTTLFCNSVLHPSDLQGTSLIRTPPHRKTLQ